MATLTWWEQLLYPIGGGLAARSKLNQQLTNTVAASEEHWQQALQSKNSHEQAYHYDKYKECLANAIPIRNDLLDHYDYLMRVSPRKAKKIDMFRGLEDDSLFVPRDLNAYLQKRSKSRANLIGWYIVKFSFLIWSLWNWQTIYHWALALGRYAWSLW